MPNLWVTPDELGADSTSPDALDAAAFASFIMWALSGRKYAGLRIVTETYECPCGSSPIYPARLWNVEPYLDGGAVLNAEPCGCGRHSGLRLRRQPVRSIQSVVSSTGETLDPSSYRLTDAQVLRAAPGHSIDLCGSVVTYTYGVIPPLGGRAAARALARELIKAWDGDDECRLPERVTSVSRQGVSYTILDDQAFLDDMRTGLYEVDLFLKAVNPDNARKKAKVFSPDRPRGTRTITPSGTYTGGTIVEQRYDLVIQQSAYLYREFTRAVGGVAQDLSTYSWAAQIRESESVDSPIILDLGPYLSIDPVDPATLVLNVPANVTATLEDVPEGASWDLFIWPTATPAAREIWLEGHVYLDPATTAVSA